MSVIAVQGSTVLSMVVWILAPFLMWKALGVTWVVFWLVPSALFVFFAAQRGMSLPAGSHRIRTKATPIVGKHDPLPGVPQADQPSGWTVVALSAMSWIVALEFAIIVMVQCAMWIALGAVLLGPWGVVPGGILSAVQMLMLFDSRRDRPGVPN